MAQVRRLQDGVTQEPYYLHRATGLSFRRIVGALAWPYGDVPGSVLVLGELRSNGNVLGARHHVHVLDEKRSMDVNELLTAMADKQERWLVSTWVTDLADPRLWMLDDFNDDRRRHRLPKLRVVEVVMASGRQEGRAAFFHALVQRRTIGEKTLFLGSNCTAAPDLARILPEQLASQHPENFPGVAALWYALAEIDVNNMPEWHERRRMHAGPADTLGGY